MEKYTRKISYRKCSQVSKVASRHQMDNTSAGEQTQKGQLLVKEKGQQMRCVLSEEALDDIGDGLETVAYRGGLGCSTPPPPQKFRRYRWSPRSHEQEEPPSRFPFAVHCVLIRF